MAIEWNRTLKALLLYVVGFILIIAVIVLVYELVSKKEFAKKCFSIGLDKVSISPYFITNIYKALQEGENNE
jgi:hypothetical protein